MSPVCRASVRSRFVACIAALLVALPACKDASVVNTNQSGGGQDGGGGLPGGNGDGVITLPDAAAGGDGANVAGPACVEEAHKAEPVPVDLMLLVDASGSMSSRVGEGPATKWTIAQDALASFVRDGRSAGLGMGLQFFPVEKPCVADSDCGMPVRPICRSNGTCTSATGEADGMCLIRSSGPATVCNPGATCTLPGVCADNGAACATIGQPCPMNGGTCQPATKYCLDYTLAECDPSLYETAPLPAKIAPLPGNQVSILRALLGRYPSGGTPMRVAVSGSLKQLTAHLAKNPGRKAALVLTSDGFPTCSPDTEHGIDTIVELVKAARAGALAIPTYVVGVFTTEEIGLAQLALDKVAFAGGTSRAFVVTANDDLAKQLQAALDAIRGAAALSCQFKIPSTRGDGIDFGNVKVAFNPTSGAREDLRYVRTLANCDSSRGGWYYDVDPAAGTPTSVHVCPASCEKFQRDATAKVDLVFGCSTQ
jgi:hypothetical protein